MPDAVRHRSQARHNENLLAEDLLDAKTTIYPDWLVTVAFYCALHLMDAELDGRYRVRSFEGGHGERRRLVDKHLTGKARQALTHYESLQSASRRARYD